MQIYNYNCYDKNWPEKMESFITFAVWKEWKNVGKKLKKSFVLV